VPENGQGSKLLNAQIAEMPQFCQVPAMSRIELAVEKVRHSAEASIPRTLSTEIQKNKAQLRAKSRAFVFKGELIDPATERSGIRDSPFQNCAGKFQVFQPSSGQFAHEQVMEFKTVGRHSCQAQWLEPLLPTVRKAGNFRTYHIHIETVPARELRTTPQLKM